jgi:hypothetical protein
MTELFLLGAGASVEAEIPSAFGMTRRMLDIFSQDGNLYKQNKILRFVVGGLLFQRGVSGENPFDGVNIEDLFNSMLLLADRKSSELSSFVSSWNPLIDELERGEVSYYTARNLIQAIYNPLEEYLAEQNRQNLGEGRYIAGFGNQINTFRAEHTFHEGFTLALNEYLKGSGGQLFKETANQMTRKLIEMTWVTDPGKIQYLVPLVNYAQQTDAVIATLNYDNTIEFSAQSVTALCDTGFESWSQAGDFTFRGGHIPLIKLHGSIDWALSKVDPSEDKPLENETIRQVVPTDDTNRDFSPSILFGGKNKLTAKGPFLSLLRAFERQLEQCNRLVVIGYSFRDDHINEYIRTWINGNISRVITIIDPAIMHFDNPFINELHRIRNRNRVVQIALKASEGLSNVTSTPT